MARGKKKNDEGEGTETDHATNPEAIERKRLKALTFSSGMLSDAPSAAGVHLNPSSTVVKHHGKDITKKSQRKSSRFLFSFPGLLAPISGGKISELKDLATKNPSLYSISPRLYFRMHGGLGGNMRTQAGIS